MTLKAVRDPYRTIRSSTMGWPRPTTGLKSKAGNSATSKPLGGPQLGPVEAPFQTHHQLAVPDDRLGYQGLRLGCVVGEGPVLGRSTTLFLQDICSDPQFAILKVEQKFQVPIICWVSQP